MFREIKLIAQIINLTNPKVFERYRIKYGFSWDVFYHGLFGLEIRKIVSKNYKEIISKIEKIHPQTFFIDAPDEGTRIFLLGSIKTFREIVDKLPDETQLQNLLDITVGNFENYNSITYRIKEKEFTFNSAYVMGILNVTPDSFSDGGKYFGADAAAEHGIEMIDKGADIIDIGGESSRPGSEPVASDEEIKRIIPVIQKILLERPSAIISVDTNKNVVASEALQHGAVIINDITGLQNDLKILDTVKKFSASLVVMHMKGNPKTMQNNPEYHDVVEEIYDFLYEQSNIALKSTVKNIFIDPGIGFGKTIEHNIEIIQRLEDFKSLGLPILIGISRKSFLGKLLNLEINSRDTSTAIAETFAVANAARIIRTHNVENCTQVCKLLSSML